jgi:hypothetical protein
MTDLSMGIQPQWTFNFRVAAVANLHRASETGRRVKEPCDFKVLRWIWRRIWSDVAGTRPF